MSFECKDCKEHIERYKLDLKARLLGGVLYLPSVSIIVVSKHKQGLGYGMYMSYAMLPNYRLNLKSQSCCNPNNWTFPLQNAVTPPPSYIDNNWLSAIL